MKVLILSTYEKTGGAAIAASRLLQALRKSGVDATMMCRRNISWGPAALRKQSWTSIVERGVIWVRNGFTTKNLWATDMALCGQDVTKTREYQEADVVHLHWVNQGFLSLGTIEKIAKSGKRVVWTMHDAWNSTGCCHLTLGCREFQNDCKHCKYYDCGKYWKIKRNIYAGSNIRFVACSEWLKEEVLSSSLMRDQSVVNIPNPIDAKTFSPQEQQEARRALNLSANKKLILFAALNVNDPFKGMTYLIDAINTLEGVGVVTLGNNGEVVSKMLGKTEVFNLGYIDNVDKLRAAYSAADVFVLPSLSENLPNTIMEAMACGTPCVGFNVGGIPEMIDHKENGYVARYKDAGDLAAGIRYVLDSHDQMGKAAREKVLREYSEKAVADRYIELYNA